MSAQQDAMTAAMSACEAAVEQLATALDAYRTAYREVAHSVYSSTGQQSTADLEHACGPHLLTQNVAARLIEIGFTPAARPLDPEWAAWLTGQIASHVHEDVGVDG
jgi:hypothetical protein